MEFGRFRVTSAGLLALSLVLLALEPRTQGQSGSTVSPPASQGSVPTLPAAESISQAAKPSPNNAASGENGANLPAANATGSIPQDFRSMRLEAGDLLEVSVYNVPELSTKARVGNSGDIYLPLIDYVHVGDLTAAEAQDLIRKRLEDGGFVRNPHVTISVVESTSQGVTILGEVVKPGIYPAIGDRKLYDLISAAGGFTPSAGRKVSVIRQRNSTTAINLNLPRNLADDLQDNIEIFPGDTISVPRAPIIYVVGDVGHPAGLLVDNGNMTVLQALALAGGTNHTARMSGVRIIRKGPEGMTETQVPLKKMLEAKAPDVTLQADDILFVPVSGVRVASGQALQAAMSAATGIAVIAVH